MNLQIDDTSTFLCLWLIKQGQQKKQWFTMQNAVLVTIGHNSNNCRSAAQVGDQGA